MLALKESDTDALVIGWEKQLLAELRDDPSVQASMNLLTPDARALLDKFISEKDLPAEVSDAFVNAVNTVLSGLKRRSVKAQTFARQVLGDGTPLKADEMQDRFETWLKTQIGTDDKRTVRFVLED